MKLFSVIYRTIFFYIFVSIAYRVMGKRELAKLGIIDLIVSILIAELVAISIENYQEPMYLTIIPIILLVLVEISISFFSVKCGRFKLLIDGKPSLIIANGKINYHEMVRQRYSLSDLLLSLRSKEIDSLDMIEYAFLESNGTLSVFKYKPFSLKKTFPLPLIIDGDIQYDTLKYLKKSDKWLLEVLKSNNVSLKNIFYAFYRNKKVFFIKKD